MKSLRGATVVGCALLCGSGAFAELTPVNDMGNGELHLFEIYNHFYGTSFDSSSGAGDTLLGTGGMDALQLEENGVFDLADSEDLIRAVFLASFAAPSQQFGYYTNPDGGALSSDPAAAAADPTGESGDFHHVLTGHHGLGDGSVVGAIDPTDGPIGLYDHATAVGNVWYSQSARNVDLRDHMVAYAVLVFDAGLGEFVVDPTRMLVAFEDLRRLGDADYNDVVVEIRFPDDEPADPNDPIPEPATLALLMIGLAGFAMRSRFSA